MRFDSKFDFRFCKLLLQLMYLVKDLFDVNFVIFGRVTCRFIFFFIFFSLTVWLYLRFCKLKKWLILFFQFFYCVFLLYILILKLFNDDFLLIDEFFVGRNDRPDNLTVAGQFRLSGCVNRFKVGGSRWVSNIDFFRLWWFDHYLILWNIIKKASLLCNINPDHLYSFKRQWVPLFWNIKFDVEHLILIIKQCQYKLLYLSRSTEKTSSPIHLGFQKSSTMDGRVSLRRIKILPSTTVFPLSLLLESYLCIYSVLQENPSCQVFVLQLRKTFHWDWLCLCGELHRMAWPSQVAIKFRIWKTCLKKRLRLNSSLEKRKLSCQSQREGL